MARLTRYKPQREDFPFMISYDEEREKYFNENDWWQYNDREETI